MNLNIKHENQNNINMFYLKDILVKDKDFSNNNSNSLHVTSHAQTRALQEKLDALGKMKKHSNLLVFQQAMRALLVANDFYKIKEKVVQSEVVTAIANSVHF